MKNFNSFNSKTLFRGILTSVFFLMMIFHSGQVQAQSVTVTSVTVNNPPATYCTNTNVTVAGNHAYPGYTLVNSSSTVTGFNINIIVNYTQPGVGIPVITPYTQVMNLGMLPAGTYTVTTNGQFNGSTTSTLTTSLVVGSAGCCSATASFTASANNLMACVGDNIVLTNTSVGTNGNQSWYQNGALVSTNSTYSTQINTAGSYDFKLVVDGTNNCSDSITQTIVVSDYPIIDLGPDSTVCDGDNYMLDAGAGRDSIFWSTGATGQFITVNNPNVYSVMVYENGCASSDTINMATISSPIIDLGPDSVVCDGDNYLLDAGTGRDSIFWSTGATGQFIPVNTANTYSVLVYENGCATSDTIIMGTIPSPTIDLGPDSTFCGNGSILLNAGVGRDSIFWSTGDVGQFLNVSLTGSYSVTVFKNGCGTSDTINLIFNAGSQVDLGPDTTICVGDSIVLDVSYLNGTYRWHDNSTAATFTTTEAGFYWVEVDMNGCVGSDSITVDTMTCVSNSINDLSLKGSLQTYPNPTSGELNIVVPSQLSGKTAEVKIIGLDGRVLYVKQISALDNTIQLMLSDVSEGIYLLQLTSEDEMWRGKVLIVE